jgi:hypothetical protein
MSGGQQYSSSFADSHLIHIPLKDFNTLRLSTNITNP